MSFDRNKKPLDAPTDEKYASEEEILGALKEDGKEEPIKPPFERSHSRGELIQPPIRRSKSYSELTSTAKFQEAGMLAKDSAPAAQKIEPPKNTNLDKLDDNVNKVAKRTTPIDSLSPRRSNSK